MPQRQKPHSKRHLPAPRWLLALAYNRRVMLDHSRHLRPPLLGLLLLLCAAACARDGGQQALAGAPPSLGMCASCHGPTGRSALRGTPHIAGQDEEYLILAMLQYRDGYRPHAAMRAVIGSLSEREIRELARWYAAQDRCAMEAGG